MAASTRRNYECCLKADVYADIEHKNASAVTADDVAGICRSIKAKGKIVHAQRVKTTIGGIYSWGIRESLTKTKPAKGVPNQQTVKSVRNRLPADDELRRLWHALDAAPRLSTAVALVIKQYVVLLLELKNVVLLDHERDGMSTGAVPHRWRAKVDEVRHRLGIGSGHS